MKSVYVCGGVASSALIRCCSHYRRWLGGTHNPMSDLEESPDLRDDSSGVPTLLVADQAIISDSNPSSPRSVSPARPDTPPFEGDSSTSRSENAVLRSRSHGSSRRLGHTRRSSKPKQEPSEESSSSARSTGDISSTTESRSSNKSSQTKYATVRPSSPQPSTSNTDKGLKDPKRPVPTRSNSSSPVAPIAPMKGTNSCSFFIFYAFIP